MKNNIVHCLLYGVSVLIIVYPDRLPIIQVSWMNAHSFWSHVEWNGRKACVGTAIVKWRTPGLASPHRWIKSRLSKPEQDTFDY